MPVLCVLGGAPERAKPQIETAIAIAKHLGTGVKALIAMPDPTNSAMYFVAGEAVMASASSFSAIKSAQDEARTALSEVYTECVAAAGSWLEADLVNETGHVQSICAAHAILADATVFPKEAATVSHPLNSVFEYALMEERLPAILAAGDTTPKGPALIAWDGSPRAMRAVRAHLPLLQSFGHAVIAHNTDKDREIGGTANIATSDALAEWLRAERVEAKVELFTGKVSEGLLSIAGAHTCDLIVMGAYGHSRIGQMLFGGTSRALLQSEDGPTLALAH
ncbi:MAG: universal stress protein [Pseudomonadota bacterium]